MWWWCFTDYSQTKKHCVLTQGTCCLRPSISCFTQLNTARYTSSSDGTLRLSLEIKSRTWMEKTKQMGRDILCDHLQEEPAHTTFNPAMNVREALKKQRLRELSYQTCQHSRSKLHCPQTVLLPACCHWLGLSLSLPFCQFIFLYFTQTDIAKGKAMICFVCVISKRINQHKISTTESFQAPFQLSSLTHKCLCLISTSLCVCECCDILKLSLYVCLWHECCSLSG